MTLYRYLFVIGIFLFSSLLASSGNYSISIGERDKDRLLVLNEIYNPFTEEFFVKSKLACGQEVLEIGCGIGLVSQKLAGIVGEKGSILATDIAKEQLDIAGSLLEKNTPQLTFRMLSACDLGVLGEKFDVVYVRFLLCHLPNPRAVIQEVKKVLKPGGKFIIEDLTGNHTLFSTPVTRGMEILHYFDELQFQLQESDDKYFAKLPQMLIEEGFNLDLLHKSHPKLDCLRTRKMLPYNLYTLKNSLMDAGLINHEEYVTMYKEVEAFSKDLSIDVFSYELGQICATYRPDCIEE